MKRFLVVLLILSVAFAGVFAQSSPSNDTSLSDPDPAVAGADTAKQYLREVSVDMFEREGVWSAKISPDNGVISARLFNGSPIAKEPIEETEAQGIKDEKVLGVKTEFLKRGVNSFTIKANRPIAIEGVTKQLSMWVVGRNKPHSLFVLLQDYFGNSYEIYMGTLDFSGWKQMKVAIPPSPDGIHGIVQASAYHGDRPGLSVVGFRVDCDPMFAKGSYYLYFDDLRAVTDLYSVENRDQDDMDDNW
ncbi:MAG: flagellar filament outer layer protein FlaA [Treponemataceae bacterium]